jgi:hypothetical protein
VMVADAPDLTSMFNRMSSPDTNPPPKSKM